MLVNARSKEGSTPRGKGEGAVAPARSGKSYKGDKGHATSKLRVAERGDQSLRSRKLIANTLQEILAPLLDPKAENLVGGLL